jgi:hypothetical protein
MNHRDTANANRRAAAARADAHTHLSGARLFIARTLWLAFALPSVALYVAGVPRYYQQVDAGCDIGVCDPLPAEVIATLGLTASGFVLGWTVIQVLLQAIWYAVGFFLFWRRGDDWLALLAAFFLVTINTPLAIPSENLLGPIKILSVLGPIALLTFYLLFPQGRLIPRWTGLTLILIPVYVIWETLLSQWEPYASLWPDWLYWLSTLVQVLIFGSIITAQIYRYRHVSTPMQRQQTKWVIVGVTVGLGAFIAFQAISLLALGMAALSWIDFSWEGLAFFGQMWSLLFPFALVLIPLTIGFSILRYRLYDIDRIINRTLVYGALTASLALVYLTLTIALQSLARLATGAVSESPLVIVVSTLVIAALFLPLRQRIQAVIDRRFYRGRYDAAKTVAAFSATLRQEVDVGQLRERLLAVVQETMQPESASLWLRQLEPRERDHPHADV